MKFSMFGEKDANVRYSRQDIVDAHEIGEVLQSIRKDFVIQCRQEQVALYVDLGIVESEYIRMHIALAIWLSERSHCFVSVYCLDDERALRFSPHVLRGTSFYIPGVGVCIGHLCVGRYKKLTGDISASFLQDQIDYYLASACNINLDEFSVSWAHELVDHCPECGSSSVASPFPMILPEDQRPGHLEEGLRLCASCYKTHDLAYDPDRMVFAPRGMVLWGSSLWGSLDRGGEIVVSSQRSMRKHDKIVAYYVGETSRQDWWQ